MNGPVPVMYSLKPLINISDDLDLPTNMYKMKPYYTDFNQFVPDIAVQTETKVSNSEIEDIASKQSLILNQLKELQNQMELLKKQLTRSPTSIEPKLDCSLPVTNSSVNLNEIIIHEVVINADPNFPPYSILGIPKIWGRLFNLKISSYVHSSITEVANEVFSQFSSQESNFNASLPTLNITLIWKNVGRDCEFIISPLTHCPIKGEVNILRYFHRHINTNIDFIEETILDSFFDVCYCLLQSSTGKDKDFHLRELNATLGKSNWFGGESMSLRDLAAWSAIKNINNLKLTQKMTKWLDLCNNDISNTVL